MNEPATQVPTKTLFAKAGSIRGDWYLINADGKTLGRLATQIAHRLKGKHKADYSPHVDMGDHIVVVNAEKIRVTGRKQLGKKYYRHTGFPGGVKETDFAKLHAGQRGIAVRHSAPENLRAFALAFRNELESLRGNGYDERLSIDGQRAFQGFVQDGGHGITSELGSWSMADRPGNGEVVRKAVNVVDAVQQG